MMLSIRSANRTDVTLLETLIQEMAEYEKLPNFITEEALARDGFGPQPAPVDFRHYPPRRRRSCRSVKPP